MNLLLLKFFFFFFLSGIFPFRKNWKGKLDFFSFKSILPSFISSPQVSDRHWCHYKSSFNSFSQKKVQIGIIVWHVLAHNHDGKKKSIKTDYAKKINKTVLVSLLHFGTHKLPVKIKFFKIGHFKKMCLLRIDIKA